MEKNDFSDIPEPAQWPIWLGGAVFILAGLGIMWGGVALWDSEPNAWVMFPFGGTFAAMGVALFFIFRTPKGKRSVVVKAEEFSTGRGRRSSVTRIYVDEDATEAEIAAARADWATGQLGGREDWAEGRIASSLDPVGHRHWYFFGAALALLVSSLIGAVWDPEVLYFAILPALVTLLVGYFSVKKHIHQTKFTASELKLATVPGLLGQRLEGEIVSGVHRRMKLEDDAVLTLTCLRTWQETRRDRDGQSTTVTKSKTLWEDTRRVTPQRRGGRNALEVPVRFELPGELPPSTARGHGVHWDLKAHIAVKGMDWRAEFRLPVFAEGSVQADVLAAGPKSFRPEAG